MRTVSVRNRFIAAFIAISAVIALFFAGKPAFAENVKPDNFSAVMYNNSNGLPTSEANDIVQADDGFIYIGSYSGLIRYDGVNFTRFDSYTGITSVVSLFIDSKNRLWVGTNDSGLALYENGAFTFYNRENGLSSLSVRDITEDGAGNIIFGTTSELACINEQGELSVIDNEAINGKYIKQLTAGNDGAVYGCTMDGMFFKMENLEIAASYSSEEMGFGIVSCITP
ncbi:MAG: two-component regulator propeller domain-containing protein, partial [Oscillospiraceae bacterium]